MQACFDFIFLAVNLAVPLVLAAEAAMIAERSGVICLGVEGIMIFGAFFAVTGSYYTGNPWLGVLLAVAGGALAGWIYGIFAVTLKGQQVVVGVAVNFFAAGITPMVTQQIWGSEGASATVNSIGTIDLSKIFGGSTGISWFVFLTILIVAGIWYFMYKTKYGLRLRMTGDFPLGLQTCGINTNRYKLWAMTASGILAAAGGAYLSVGYGNLFVTDMVAGRGYMGVAANIFGGWTPLGGAFAALFFAVVQTLRYTLTNLELPSQLMQMLPYLVTLIALVLFGRNSKSPEGLGKL